jgi:hypothetical protein
LCQTSVSLTIVLGGFDGTELGVNGFEAGIAVQASIAVSGVLGQGGNVFSAAFRHV